MRRRCLTGGPRDRETLVGGPGRAALSVPMGSVVGFEQRPRKLHGEMGLKEGLSLDFTLKDVGSLGNFGQPRYRREVTFLGATMCGQGRTRGRQCRVLRDRGR